MGNINPISVGKGRHWWESYVDWLKVTQLVKQWKDETLKEEPITYTYITMRFQRLGDLKYIQTANIESKSSFGSRSFVFIWFYHVAIWASDYMYYVSKLACIYINMVASSPTPSAQNSSKEQQEEG